MTRLITTLFCAIFSVCFSLLLAQTGCPGCEITLPDLPEDTIYLSPAPNGQVGIDYDEDLSFRLPLTTTPVANTGADVPPGLAITRFTIDNVTGLPAGLSWEPNQTIFETADTTDGCVKLCGIPLVAGTYIVDVVVTARVLIFDQSTSVSFPIVIEPAVLANDGFSIVNSEGCGEVTASFVNNLPSNNVDGFSYLWDFGNGNMSTDENPVDQTYDMPGTYTVNYQAIVDTAGFFLSKVTVHDVSCTDILSAVDLKINVFNPDGDVIYTAPIQDNTNPPVVFEQLLPIGPGNHTLQVIDDDGGLDGQDTECALVNFSQDLQGTFTTDDFSLTIELLNPVDTFDFSSTVTVNAIPDAPTVLPIFSTPICEGDNGLLFADNQPGSFQWFRDSMAITGANDNDLEVDEAGDYYLVYTTPEGCSASSDITTVSFGALPEGVVLSQDGNLLQLVDPAFLPENFAVTWTLDGGELASQELLLCAEATGEYVLTITDLDNGCSASDTLSVVYDANLPCSTPTQELVEWQDWRIYPNPGRDLLQMDLPADFREGQCLIFDAIGRQILQKQVAGWQTQYFDTSYLPAGLYLVKLQNEEGQASVRKWIKE